MTFITTCRCDICGAEFKKDLYNMKWLPPLKRIDPAFNIHFEDNLVEHLCELCWKNALNMLNEYYAFIDGAKVNIEARDAKKSS